MIYLTSDTSNLGFGLVLEKKTLTIKNTIDDFIVVDQDLDIVLEDGVHANILDMTTHSNIKVKLLNASFLTYHIINSTNTNRMFECYGNLKVMQISLEESKEELNVQLLQEQASVSVELLAIGNYVPLTFIQRIEHQAKHTSSNLSNFGVALGNANVMFDTTGRILKGMAKSKCVQLSKGIVMDDTASVTSKPILLIDEYDVIANHGASIGKMSDESLFYLMSRGLSKQEAFLLILEGIIAPFMNQIPDASLKNEINGKIEKMMKR
ncbi:MAG: SufD family Fe-S cluster assembly protein [Anaeroplasmataceae bacterium]|jgi:ABC-type transport system involved in Fe-S cluster assembly, permease component|nr:SufD family Fe-S cluster assembly protein [Anaeroplasmataceae bacterium]